MPPGQPEKESSPFKRHRRSRSLSMTQPQEGIDLTESSAETPKLETSSSRKHDRHEEDPQVEGPAKYPKLNKNSEPANRKDTRTTPRRKQKESGKTINQPKASRASNHNDLKAKVKTLDRELRDTEKVLDITKQALKDTNQNFQCNTSELKRVRKVCDEKSEEIRTQNLNHETEREKFQSLKDLVDDPVNGIQALQESCRRKDEESKVKDEKIISQQQELDETKKELEKAIKEAEAARTMNDSNGSRNEMLAKKERTAKNTLKKERDEHKKTIAAFEADKAELKQRCAEVKAKLKDQEDKHNEIIAHLQQRLQDSLPQSQRFNFKVSDDIVHHDYTALESKIRQFVYKYTRPVLNATDQELQFVWPNWSPTLREFLASPILCNLVLEAYIWERLLMRVFTPWSEVWAGELGQPLENVLSKAGAESERAGFESETYAHYQYLRSSSSSFICRLNGESFRPEDFDSAINAMVSTMQKLCGLPKVTDAMKADAIGIFKHARDFEILLRKLKAAYSFCMSKPTPSGELLKYGVSFDDEGMVDRSPSQRDRKDGKFQRVDFIKSPGLRKRGNNDGDEYADDTWLVKMGVVCDAGRFFMESDHSNTARPTSIQTPRELLSREAKQKDEGQDVGLQCQIGTAANVRLGTPIPDSTHIKSEETDSQQVPNSSSTAALTPGSPAPGSHDASQLQPTMATNEMARNEEPPKTDNNVHDGKSQHQINEQLTTTKRKCDGTRG